MVQFKYHTDENLKFEGFFCFKKFRLEVLFYFTFCAVFYLSAENNSISELRLVIKIAHYYAVVQQGTNDMLSFSETRFLSWGK